MIDLPLDLREYLRRFRFKRRYNEGVIRSRHVEAGMFNRHNVVKFSHVGNNCYWLLLFIPIFERDYEVKYIRWHIGVDGRPVSVFFSNFEDVWAD